MAGASNSFLYADISRDYLSFVFAVGLYIDFHDVNACFSMYKLINCQMLKRSLILALTRHALTVLRLMLFYVFINFYVDRKLENKNKNMKIIFLS